MLGAPFSTVVEVPVEQVTPMQPFLEKISTDSLNPVGSIRENGRGRPSSCRKRLRSNSKPRLALHEVLLLDVGPDGTITVVDVILIRPRRRDRSRPGGKSAFYFSSVRIATILAEA